MKANIEIEIPSGKKAEWVNGILTLVDEQVKDNRPVTERIKTFQDAYNELGEDHKLVRQYNACLENGLCSCETTEIEDSDIVAYLKLCIIAAAINEGWQPQFTTDEWRYYPWFCLYTQEEIDEMDEEKKSRVVSRSSSHASGSGGVSYANAYDGSSGTDAFIGSRLAFKTRELAKYAGEQFIEIWADYVFKAQ